ERTPERISFDVSEPGVPVLVKTSYFPNWTVSGADAVHRVTPNLMLVVPTDDHVELRYRRSPVDLLAHAMTLVGLVGLWWLVRQRPVEVPEQGAGWMSNRLDRLLALERTDIAADDRAADDTATDDTPADDTPADDGADGSDVEE